MESPTNIIPSSFRDPSGFLFFRNGILYRQINKSYEAQYNLFQKSGLYNELVAKKLLITHDENDISAEKPELAYKIIKPQTIPFISYPYEWSFTQLQQAALLTLEIEKISLAHGMSLKDASAFNVQFLEGHPIFIDTLSFEEYKPNLPWVAYRQFCQHFLAPLLLMRYTDIRTNQLLRIFLDGIPLDLTSRLLPKRTWFHFRVLMHVHMHSRSITKYSDTTTHHRIPKVSKIALLGIIDDLTTTIQKINWHPEKSEWMDYYDTTNYSGKAFEHKKAIVTRFLETIHPSSVWDLGANNGLFSRLASAKGIPTIAFDIDQTCVDMNYRQVRENNESSLLPLQLDLANPSPGIGWNHHERDSLIDRGPADMVLALALIHHLVITNNIPFDRVASFLSDICNTLIIEFVPKSDSQIQRMLMNREDIFGEYNQENFETTFSRFFEILQKEPIMNSERTLYLLKKR